MEGVVVLVGVNVRVGVGVSVASIFPIGLPGPDSHTTSMIAPMITSATAP
jgi:hypothetical protein